MTKKRWYVVHVYSGFEGKVAESLREQIAKEKMEDQFEEVLIPSHEVVEVVRGKKVTKEKKFFPGYILVKMALADDSWHLVQDIAKVTGFLGPKGRPSPVSEAEAARLLQQVEEGVAGSGPELHFDVGEQLRVSDGPFASFNGVVEEVDHDRSRLKVSVSIFGRATPVDLDFTQVEKL